MRKNGGSGKLRMMTMTALLSAVLCALGPMAIPVGPVPITLANLVMYLALYLLGWKMGTVSCLVYVVMGLVGLPVFAGFSGGAGKLLGPTGGYIAGYVLMAAAAGFFIQKFQNRCIHGMGLALGTAVCYALGTAWYCVTTQAAAGTAMALCVIPFLPGDLVKIALALSVGPMLRRNLQRAGLLPEHVGAA